LVSEKRFSGPDKLTGKEEKKKKPANSFDSNH
jgi:hypothetical protein